MGSPQQGERLHHAVQGTRSSQSPAVARERRLMQWQGPTLPKGTPARQCPARRTATRSCAEGACRSARSTVGPDDVGDGTAQWCCGHVSEGVTAVVHVTYSQ
jgi:hypothetical protein